VSFLRRLLGKKAPAERDEDRFARRVVEALHAASPEIRIVYDSEAFELRHVDGASAGQRTFPHPRRWILPARITTAQRAEMTESYPEHEFFGGQAK
jgi:hypothetical protein